MPSFCSFNFLLFCDVKKKKKQRKNMVVLVPGAGRSCATGPMPPRGFGSFAVRTVFFLGWVCGAKKKTVVKRKEICGLQVNWGGAEKKEKAFWEREKRFFIGSDSILSGGSPKRNKRERRIRTEKKKKICRSLGDVHPAPSRFFFFLFSYSIFRPFENLGCQG